MIGPVDPISSTQWVTEAKIGDVAISERGMMANPVEGRLPAQVRLAGNVGAAKEYIPIARGRLADMHASNVDDYEIWGNAYRDNNGTTIQCKRNFDNDSVEVVVPTTFEIENQTLTKTVNSGGVDVGISDWEVE